MYVEEPLSAPSVAGRCKWFSVQSEHAVRVVPDACMDVIWNGKDLFIAGPDTRPVLYGAPVGTRTIGVRFAPGHGARVLALPVTALVNERVALVDCWGDDARRLSDQLAAVSAQDPHAALELIERAVLQRLAHGSAADRLIDTLVQQFEHGQAESADPPPVAKLARSLGLSERQLLRRCQAQLGYGPKFLARVLRFQRFMSLLRSAHSARRSSLAELAHATGYADQAHLAHEVAELAGTTPSQLRAEAAMSDSDKTHHPAEAHAGAHDPHRQPTNPARRTVPVAERARP